MNYTDRPARLALSHPTSPSETLAFEFRGYPVTVTYAQLRAAGHKKHTPALRLLLLLPPHWDRKTLGIVTQEDALEFCRALQECAAERPTAAALLPDIFD